MKADSAVLERAVQKEWARRRRLIRLYWLLLVSVLAATAAGFIWLGMLGEEEGRLDLSSVTEPLEAQNQELAIRQAKLSSDLANLESTQQSRLSRLEEELSREVTRSSQALEELRGPLFRSLQMQLPADATWSGALQEEILGQQSEILAQLRTQQELVEKIRNSQLPLHLLEDVRNLTARLESNDQALRKLQKTAEQLQGRLNALDSQLEALQLPPVRSFLLAAGGDLDIPEYGIRVQLRSEKDGQLSGFQILDMQSGQLLFPSENAPATSVLGQEIRFRRGGNEYSLTPGFKASRLFRSDIIGIEVRRIPGSAATGD